MQKQWQPKAYIRYFYPEVIYSEQTREQRKQSRIKYIKPLFPKLNSLQVESLKAYSSVYKIPIDSQEYFINIGQGSGLTHKIILEDNRPIPLHFNTLLPWQQTEIEQIIKPRYIHWLNLGGYHTYKWGIGPAFYIDLWRIAARLEQPIQLEWYLPEVKGSHWRHHSKTEEQGQPQEKDQTLHQEGLLMKQGNSSSSKKEM